MTVARPTRVSDLKFDIWSRTCHTLLAWLWVLQREVRKLKPPNGTSSAESENESGIPFSSFILMTRRFCLPFRKAMRIMRWTKCHVLTLFLPFSSSSCLKCIKCWPLGRFDNTLGFPLISANFEFELSFWPTFRSSKSMSKVLAYWDRKAVRNKLDLVCSHSLRIRKPPTYQATAEVAACESWSTGRCHLHALQVLPWLESRRRNWTRNAAARNICFRFQER